MNKRPGSQDPASRPARSSPPPSAARARGRHHRDDGHSTDSHEADLDAYITRTVDDAPPLTSEQRDRLALILRGRHRR